MWPFSSSLEEPLSDPRALITGRAARTREHCESLIDTEVHEKLVGIFTREVHQWLGDDTNIATALILNYRYDVDPYLVVNNEAMTFIAGRSAQDVCSGIPGLTAKCSDYSVTFGIPEGELEGGILLGCRPPERGLLSSWIRGESPAPPPPAPDALARRVSALKAHLLQAEAGFRATLHDSMKACLLEWLLDETGVGKHLDYSYNEIEAILGDKCRTRIAMEVAVQICIELGVSDMLRPNENGMHHVRFSILTG
jgi:hypothetical protein